MGALLDLCNTTRDWLAVGNAVYGDDLVISWVRMAEEAMSESLRVADMIQIDQTKTITDRFLLPKDLLLLDTVRDINGKVLNYIPRTDFYNQEQVLDDKYTRIGNYIILGKYDAVNGTDVEISYYQDIPPLTNGIAPTEENPDTYDGSNWLWNRYKRLYIMSTLVHATLYGVENDQAGTWADAAAGFINTMNEQHKLDKSAGSRLVSKKRSFG